VRSDFQSYPSSKPHSRQGGLSDDEIYNSKQAYSIKRREINHHFKRHQAHGTEENYTIASADNEASNTKFKPDISFVLERKDTDSSGSSPGKLGLFTIALVMCMCCISSFFTPIGSATAIQAKGNVGGVPGRTLLIMAGE
jgi:hypothetical protein